MPRISVGVTIWNAAFCAGPPMPRLKSDKVLMPHESQGLGIKGHSRPTMATSREMIWVSRAASLRPFFARCSAKAAPMMRPSGIRMKVGKIWSPASLVGLQPNTRP